jgi:hypothetical protein
VNPPAQPIDGKQAWIKEVEITGHNQAKRLRNWPTEQFGSFVNENKCG